jgi:non-ribosomal peptide synthetase component F
MTERQITVCHFVPSMLAEFVRVPQAGRLTSLRHVICSGEALPPSLARRALDLWAAELHNLYGPTEAAIDVTYWDVPRDLDPADPVPIGLPVDNTFLRVMDDEGHPVPPGGRTVDRRRTAGPGLRRPPRPHLGGLPRGRWAALVPDR